MNNNLSLNTFKVIMKEWLAIRLMNETIVSLIILIT